MRSSKQIIDTLALVRDRAQDPDFKLLWEQKRLELIKLAERGGITSESIQ